MFCLGILFAEYIKDIDGGRNKLHWQQPVLLIEILILICCSFIKTGVLDLMVNMLISFICGIHVQSFRRLNGNVYSTTMCTGNLRAGTDYFYYGFIKKDPEMKTKSKYFFGIISMFIIGVIFGSFMTKIFGEFSSFFPAIILFIPLIWIGRSQTVET